MNLPHHDKGHDHHGESVPKDELELTGIIDQPAEKEGEPPPRDGSPQTLLPVTFARCKVRVEGWEEV